VPQSDDGVVIAHGHLAGKPAVTMAIEAAFQGGNLGEVSASKIASALALARRACERGNRLNNADARDNRAASIEVRKKWAEPWNAS
jgi:acetyl-CoA carboxylase carboxyltransferase component